MKKLSDKFKNILCAELSLSIKWWTVILVIILFSSLILYNNGTSYKLNSLVLQEANATAEKITQSDSEQITEINLLSSTKEELNSSLLSKSESKKAMEDYNTNKVKYTNQISQINTEITGLDSSIQQKQVELNQKIAAKEEQRRIAAEQEAAAKKTAGNSGIIVYRGQTGTKYHRQSCRTLKSGAYPITLEEALSEGRDPCKVCKP